MTQANRNNSEWHSIRPYSPPIQLTIKEITSISCAFVLSSSFSLSWSLSDSDEETIVVDDLESNTPCSPSSGDDDEYEAEDLSDSSKRPIASALSRGLNVLVNNSNWDRVLIRVDEKVDEAVLIIYNLMPGRQYDIELGFMPPVARPRNRENRESEDYQMNILRESVVTEDIDIENQAIDSSAFIPPISSAEHSNFSVPSMGTQTSQTNASPHTHHNTAPPLMTDEDHVAHLQHVLSAATTERDQLAASIKSTRKESQKSDAALRSEIDKLKGQSDKQGPAEHRARQKTLALQESVKRAQMAASKIEEDIVQVKALIPDLLATKGEREHQAQIARDDYQKVKREREKLDQKHSKAIESLNSELSNLQHKQERLATKRDKLEKITNKDLEHELRETELLIEQAEQEAGGAAWATSSPDSSFFPDMQQQQQQQQHPPDDASSSFPGSSSSSSPLELNYLLNAQQTPISPPTSSASVVGKTNRFSLPPPISPPAPIQRPQPGRHFPSAHRTGSLPNPLTPPISTPPRTLPGEIDTVRPPPATAPLLPHQGISAPIPKTGKWSSPTLSSLAAPFQPSGKPSLLFGGSGRSSASHRLGGEKKNDQRLRMMTILRNPKRDGNATKD